MSILRVFFLLFFFFFQAEDGIRDLTVTGVQTCALPILMPPISPAADHMLGLMGGIIWGTGTVFNLVAANLTGVAVSYAIGQSAPMVAALWGILVWKEFQGADRQAKTLLALMFLFYLLAILLIAKANTVG